MATPFVNTLKNTGGDYNTVSDWEVGQQCNLTLTTTKVFSHGGISGGTFANDDTVTGQTSGATGSVVGVVTSTQILLDGITGTFTSGEVVQAGGGASVTISDAGDSASAVLECYTFVCSDNSVQITGWTTSATNTILIKAASGHEHLGVWGDGFIFEGNINYGIAFWVNQSYTTVQDITVKNINTGTSAQGFRFDLTYVSVKRVFGQAKVHGFFINATNSGCENCVAIAPASPTGSGFYFGNWLNSTSKALNCTAVGAWAYGFNRDGANGANVTATNCVSYGAVTADFKASSPGLTMTTCASGDTSATGTSPQTGVVLTDGVDFVSPSTGDYTPTATGKLADPNGTDLSTFFDDDITGTAR